MCAVSAVSGYYLDQWPQRNPLNQQPWVTDPSIAQELREIIRRLDAIDKRLGDVECHDDDKRAFMDSLGL